MLGMYPFGSKDTNDLSIAFSESQRVLERAPALTQGEW